MFTGIVSEKGVVGDLQPTDGGVHLTINAPRTVADVAVGDSVAVNGVCLTVTSTADGSFACDVVAETMDRTAIGLLSTGSEVNLERPTPAGGRLDGHVVQGHVDGVGTVSAIDQDGSSKRFTIAIPTTLAPYAVVKGSIAIDGTSLTLTDVSGPSDTESWVSVAVIPHTLEHTVFGSRCVGDRVNLEMDILAKYVERMMEMNR